MFSKDLPIVKNIKIGHIYLSDDAPLQMTVKISMEKSAGIWRFNNSFILEKEFKTKISVLQEYIMHNDTEDVNPLILWEGAKVVLWGEIIAYASFRKKQKQKARTSLERKIEELEKNTQSHSIGET